MQKPKMRFLQLGIHYQFVSRTYRQMIVLSSNLIQGAAFLPKGWIRTWFSIFYDIHSKRLGGKQSH
jgi:hypothetical protein